MATTSTQTNTQGNDCRSFLVTFDGATVNSGLITHGLQFVPQFATCCQQGLAPKVDTGGSGCVGSVTFPSATQFRVTMPLAVAAGTVTFNVTVGRIPQINSNGDGSSGIGLRNYR